LYPEYPFESHFLGISGHRLHYIDEGEGPVVVMVHGNPTWSYYYRNIISILAETHRVIAIDHMGCGLSDKPQDYPYTLDQHISNLQYLLQYLNVDKYSLIVHDWGGAIGMGCAVRSPRRIERIAVMNTAAFRSSRIPLRIRICRWPIIGALLVRGLNGFAGPALSMAVEKPLPKETAQAYIAPYNSWQNRVAIHGFVRDIPLNSRHRSYSTLVAIEKGLSLIKEMHIPLLLLWGGKDFCFDEVFYREWCVRFPDAQRHYFPDGGHYILEDKLKELIPLFVDFFRAEPPDRGGER
jgi:haloalkane dehalogenase